MSKFSETIDAVKRFNKVYHQKGMEDLVVMRYKARKFRDVHDKYVPNGVELVNVPDTSEAKKGLQPLLESIPGIKCVSILLLTPELVVQNVDSTWLFSLQRLQEKRRRAAFQCVLGNRGHGGRFADFGSNSLPSRWKRFDKSSAGSAH